MGENLIPKKLFLVSFIIVLLFTPVCSLADNKILYPTDDTYVDAFAPGGIYGASAELNVGFQDLADQDRRCRTFLKFDLNSIPASAIITSATLELEATAYTSTMSPTAVTTHFVFPLPWSEFLLNWNSPPNQLGGFIPDASDTQFINAPGIYQWNVTSHVMSAFYGALPYSVMLKVIDDEFVSGQSDFVQFRSKETGPPPTPKLIVEYYFYVEPVDPPELEGSVKLIKITGLLEPYKDKSNLIWVDGSDYGQQHRKSIYDLTGGPTDYSVDGRIKITYTGKTLTTGKPSLIDSDPDSGDDSSTSATFEYDSLDRLVHATSNPTGSDAQTFTDLDLSYDILGNLNAAQVSHDNGSYASWTLGYNTDGNIFKRVYEKKNNTMAPPLFTGIVDYFSVDNENQLLYKTIPGSVGPAILYNYDDDRLTLIANGGPLRAYLYNQNNMLDEYTNHQNHNYDSALNYSYDAFNRLAAVKSQTNIPLPETTFLGQLSLTYNDNGTLNQIGYTTDEDTSTPVQPIYYTNYTYDGLDRRIRSEYISHIPEIPGIIVVMDPEAPELEYTTTHYIYDNHGRLAWTVDSNGYVTRTLYNQGVGLDEKKMVQIHMEEPGEIYLTTFEHNAAGELLRTNDLAGNFTQHDNDSNGNSFGSYVLGIHGGGGSLSGALGQVFQMSTYAEYDDTPFPPDPCLRFEFDQYGDFGVVIQEKDFSLNAGDVSADATKKVAKKKLTKNKKTTKKKPAQDNQKGCTEIVIGDLNGDCKNNLLDFAIYCNWWLTNKSK